MNHRNTNNKYSDKKCPKMANKICKNGIFWFPKWSKWSQEYQQQIHWLKMAKTGQGQIHRHAHTDKHTARQTFK